MNYILVLFCFSFTYLFGQDTYCDLKKDKDGIKVYTCKTEHAKFKTLKAEFVLHNISIATLENFLLNVENYPSWQYNMIRAELIQKVDAHKLTYRSEVKAPWPVENREMLMNLSIRLDETGQGVSIEGTNFESELPVRDGVVRVPYMHGTWTVIKNEEDLQVDYILRIDPGGSIPVWLVNIAMAEGPYISFRNLKQQLEKK